MSKERELREHCCCFTGHRPEKLTMPEHEVKAALEAQIRATIRDGFQIFISGMARGVDIWAADIVLQLRNEGQPIRLICALPFPGFGLNWSEKWQNPYRQILKDADMVWTVCPKYSQRCFQIRNQWMVDRSSRVIAVYNGAHGGTRNTIEYAASQGIPIIKIWGPHI